MDAYFIFNNNQITYVINNTLFTVRFDKGTTTKLRAKIAAAVCELVRAAFLANAGAEGKQVATQSALWHFCVRCELWTNIPKVRVCLFLSSRANLLGWVLSKM